MYSDSFCSNNGVPPYLRAHAARKSYSPIGGDGRIGSGSASQEEGMLGWRRAIGAVAVFVVFIGAVSRSSSNWVASGRGARGADQRLQDGGGGGGGSYRGIFEAFEVSSLAGVDQENPSSRAMPTHGMHGDANRSGCPSINSCFFRWGMTEQCCPLGRIYVDRKLRDTLY